jgi:hypothetical protein
VTTHATNRREEGNETVAKKAQKRSATKKAARKPAKAARKPAAKAPKKPVSKAAPKAAPPAKRAGAPSRPAPPSTRPSLLALAERLRDQIRRSKLTHPNPWVYGAKARGWGDRVQVLVEEIAVTGDSPALQRSIEALDAELQGDRDFQEARRLF